MAGWWEAFGNFSAAPVPPSPPSLAPLSLLPLVCLDVCLQVYSHFDEPELLDDLKDHWVGGISCTNAPTHIICSNK